jgi:CO/xanthine dehydrogenase Mo-binding subunit
MGSGVSFFTEIVAADAIENCDILGLGMFDLCEIRVHPTGSAIVRLGTISARGTRRPSLRSWRAESAFQRKNITIEEGDTNTAPYGLGTYGSRSTPVAGAATAMAGRKIRAKAQIIAAYLLEVHDDLGWDVDRFRVKGVPEMSKTMIELAFAAYNNVPGRDGAWARGGQPRRPHLDQAAGVDAVFLAGGVTVEAVEVVSSAIKIPLILGAAAVSSAISIGLRRVGSGLPYRRTPRSRPRCRRFMTG